jgi:cytochrome c biogenesis protein CcmG/thiol:disulfide interchange protein DsbE
LNGEGQLRLSSLRGKAVVLNFWASWCVPCKQEAPLLETATKQYRSAGLVVVGVDAQDFRSDARRFVRRFRLTYPVVRDDGTSTLTHYDVNGFPETWFIDRSGHLVGEHVNGPLTREQLVRNIAIALRR